MSRLTVGIIALPLGLLRLVTENQPWPFEWVIDAACILAGAAIIGQHFWRKRKQSHA
jgi:hypothetical protein